MNFFTITAESNNNLIDYVFIILGLVALLWMLPTLIAIIKGKANPDLFSYGFLLLLYSINIFYFKENFFRIFNIPSIIITVVVIIVSTIKITKKRKAI